jgi:two-component system, NarL family, nitrate/nitrite response regulator NarL
MRPIRVLLVDDALEILDKVESFLGEEFRVVAKATRGLAAVEMAINLSPDVIILDISMPDQNGLDTATQIRERGCAAKILFLTALSDPELIAATFMVGGSAYVLKHRIGLDLAWALSEAVSGRSFVSPQHTQDRWNVSSALTAS